MTPGSSQEIVQKNALARMRPSHSPFPTDTTLETVEQQRRFELLRLAFFVLKLRKIEQRLNTMREENAEVEARDQELAWRGNLLRHAIFHQVLTLIKLDAREQAMQIILTCRKS
ncbi:MAG TPA: hypothetical protein VFQ36_01545 [Ktedonobacteraceae bacterium]|nr:hypothetical protein [Ktedonobacteraceae bacterium]